MMSISRNKKQCVKWALWAALILIMTLVFMPQKAAADTKYKAKISVLKQNTWSLQKQSDWAWNSNTGDSTYTDYYWKITVPADGYLKIQVNTSKNSPSLTIHKKVKATATQRPWEYNESYVDKLSRSFNSTVTIRQALKKGTYYIEGSSGIKYRWSFVKVKNPNTLNYCKFRAKAVKSGVKQTILFNHGYEYSRWFKVVLPKKKTITVTLEGLDGADVDTSVFTVYKANGARINCPSLTNKTFRTPSLPKGTYYVRVRPYYIDEYEMGTGRLYSFSWK